MSKWTDEMINDLMELYEDHTFGQIAEKISKKHKKVTANAVRKAYERYAVMPKDFSEPKKGPKILVFDIELFPMEVYTWSIWQDSIPLSMVKEDWSVLSFACKWYGEDEVFYYDVQGQKNLRNDKKILKKIWKFLDECDIAIGHNSDSFDIKKLNARFLEHGMQPPSSYRKMDTKKMAKRFFAHTSNKLEFLTEKHNTKYKKLKHSKFPGFSLWRACLEGNKEAYKELKEYNIHDILSQEELFTKLLPWDSSINFSMYSDDETPRCTCGSTEFKKNGFYYTNAAKYQKYKCKNCGAEWRDKKNLKKNERTGTRR